MIIVVVHDSRANRKPCCVSCERMLIHQMDDCGRIVAFCIPARRLLSRPTRLHERLVYLSTFAFLQGLDSAAPEASKVWRRILCKVRALKKSATDEYEVQLCQETHKVTKSTWVRYIGGANAYSRDGIPHVQQHRILQDVARSHLGLST